MPITGATPFRRRWPPITGIDRKSPRDFHVARHAHDGLAFGGGPDTIISQEIGKSKAFWRARRFRPIYAYLTPRIVGHYLVSLAAGAISAHSPVLLSMAAIAEERGPSFGRAATRSRRMFSSACRMLILLLFFKAWRRAPTATSYFP